MSKGLFLVPFVGLFAISEGVLAEEKATPVFAPAGSTLAVGARDGTVALWNVTTGTRLARLYEPQDPHFLRASALLWEPKMRFSPDGKLLATQRGSEPVKLWSVAESKEVASLGGKTVVHQMEFSPDGKFLVTLAYESKGSGRNLAGLWEVSTRKAVATFHAAEDKEFRDVAFSPDSKTLIAVVDSRPGHRPDPAPESPRENGEATIQVWNAETGKELAHLKGTAVLFAPVGRTLAVWSKDGPVRIWDVVSGKEQALGDPGGGVK